jgi:hypothetical protein
LQKQNQEWVDRKIKEAERNWGSYEDGEEDLVERPLKKVCQ